MKNAMRRLRELLAPSGETDPDDHPLYGSLARQRADSANVMQRAKEYLAAEDRDSMDALKQYADAERGRYGAMFSAQARNLPEYQGLANQAARSRDSSQFVNQEAFKRAAGLQDQRNNMYSAAESELRNERVLANADANRVLNEEREKILTALGLRLKPKSR